MARNQGEITDGFLTGRVMWAKVTEPQESKKSRGKKSYSLDIEVHTADVKKLKAAGVQIGTKKFDKKLKKVDGVTYLAGIKRPELNGNDEMVQPLKLVGKNLQPFEELVGNGSVCKIKFAIIPIEDGESIMYLKVVQVLEHVPYEGADDMDGFEDEGGGDDMEGFENETKPKAKKKAKAKASADDEDEEEEF